MSKGQKSLSQADVDALIQQASSGERLPPTQKEGEPLSIVIQQPDHPITPGKQKKPSDTPGAPRVDLQKPGPVKPRLVFPSAANATQSPTPVAASPVEMDTASEDKAGLFARIKDRLSSLRSSKPKFQEAPKPDPVSELQQRLARIESVCDRLNPLKEDDGPIVSILERLRRVEATIATLCEPAEDEDAVDVDDLLKRLDELEKAAGSNGELKDSIEALEQYAKRLSSRIEAISVNLQDSLGYAVHKHFTCRSCGARGNVAFTIKCTECGHEGLQGWWPEK